MAKDERDVEEMLRTLYEKNEQYHNTKERAVCPWAVARWYTIRFTCREYFGFCYQNNYPFCWMDLAACKKTAR